MADENVTDQNETEAEEPVTEVADEAVVAAPEAEQPAADAKAADEVVAAAPDEPAEEPVAEAAEKAPAAPPEEAVEAAPAPQSGPKPKRKRLPRSERPKRTRPKRVPSAERKPIVRLEAPDQERGRRQERQGTVVSDAMEKTIVVRVDVVKAHPRYKKVVRRSVKFHAHDETGQAKVGDIVRIIETRPLSKTKRWRLAEVVQAAK
jgi:small subunit ribosomal protein S17